MADFSQTFTGKNTAVVLPSGEGVQKAQQGLSDLILSAEELRYKTFKENEAQFLKNVTIDPVFVLSDSARKYQMQLIEEYNQKWGKRAQQTNYNLSGQDKQTMLTEKNFITSVAQGQLEQMEMYKQHKELVEKNPGKFSLTEFAKATERYLKTGVYDQTMPAWQPLDFGAYANEEAKKLGFNLDRKEVPVGYNMVATEAWNIPRGKEGEFVVSLLGKNPQADADFFDRWNKADKEAYYQRGEAEGKNPILLWAQDEFSGVRRSEQTGKRTIPGAKTTSGFSSKLPVDATNNKNDNYDVVPTKFGSFDFNSYLNLGFAETAARSQKIQKYVDLKTGQEKTLNGAADFKVVGYSADKDMIIIELVKNILPTPDNPEGIIIRTTPNVGLKGSEYDDMLRFKFGIDRGSLLKKYGGKTQETVVTPTKPEAQAGVEASLRNKIKLY